MRVVFQISMDYLKAGIQEAKTLMNTYNIEHKVVRKEERFLIVDLPGMNNYDSRMIDKLRHISWRSATIKRVLIVYNEFRDSIDREEIYSPSLINIISNVKSAAIHVHLFSPNVINKSRVGEVIDLIYQILFKSFEGRIDLSNPEIIVALYNYKDILWLGLEIYEAKKKGFDSRRSKYRPVFSPFALHPKLSRLMINLSGALEGSIIVDPFCGVGSIPMEASILEINCLCIELWYKWCQGSIKNIQWINHSFEYADVINADSLRSLFRDHTKFYVVTDPPYGRITSIGNYDRLRIYEDFITNYVVGSKATVFMSPFELDDLLMSHDLEISFKDIIPVHNNLTRNLYVVKR